jgi:hypothetical protein
MDHLNKYRRRPDRTFQIKIMFDVVRAIMYISVAYYLFTGKFIHAMVEGQQLGNGFIRGFASLAFIYGVFRLWRAYITFKQSRRPNFNEED